MISWKGFFTENEALEIVKCIETYDVKVETEHNKDILRSAVDKLLGEHPMRDSILNKIDILNEHQVVEVINASKEIAAQSAFTSSQQLKYRDNVEASRENLISNVFNPQ